MNTCCLVKLHNLFNKRFQIKLVIVRGTDLGIETEIIDHLLHGRNLIDDRLCRALEDLLVTTLEFGADFHLDTLCGQLNRRQRILDFMGQTARYLAPRFRFAVRTQARSHHQKQSNIPERHQSEGV